MEQQAAEKLDEVFTEEKPKMKKQS